MSLQGQPEQPFKITVSRDVMPSSVVDKQRRVGGA